MKKTLIAASIAALSAGFVAAPAMAEVAGHVGATLTQPTDDANNDGDTMLALEVGGVYSHESGAYAGLLFETVDLLDSDNDFDGSTVELTLGYGMDLDDALSIDAGFLYNQALDTDIDETIEIFFGAGYTVSPEISTSAYVFYDIDSDVDETRLELFGEFTGIEAVDLYGEYVINLQETDEMTLELGAGKEIIPQNYVTGAFRMDLDDSDFSVLEFTYTYSF